MLRIERISKSFGPVRANNGITLEIAAGEVFGILGENGAGKSTLGKILSGFIAPDEGRVFLDGKPVPTGFPRKALSAGIGMLHQDPLDFPPHTCLENYLAGPWTTFFQNKRKAAKEFLMKAESLGFDLNPDTILDRLTVGERQQLEILRLLRAGVRVLVLDEPTVGISSAQADALAAAMQTLTRHSITTILISHKIEDVERHCDRIAVLRSGKLEGIASRPYSTSALVRLMFSGDVPMRAKPHFQPREVVMNIQEIIVDNGEMTIGPASLPLEAGDVVGLAGAEGSGQGLFLRACAGLLPPISGAITGGTTMGQKRLSPRHLKKIAAFCPTSRLEEGIFPGLTITEHAALTATKRHFFLGWESNETQALALIAKFGIHGRPASRAENLSGGNQQKLMLALLPNEARTLFLEHPTRGLDLESARQVWAYLEDRTRHGVSIVFSSSDLEEILRFSRQVLVFFNGLVKGPFLTADLDATRLGSMIGGTDA